MSYKETLNSFEKADHIYEPETRVEEISHDIEAAISDDSVFGQLIANSVGEAIAQAIDKSGLDAFVNDSKSSAMDSLNNTIHGAVQDTINSQEFTVGLAEKMAEKEVDREMPNLDKDHREIEP